jgi:hypothetical protein
VSAFALTVKPSSRLLAVSAELRTRTRFSPEWRAKFTKK